jgi:hypothetical protein
MAKKRNNDFFSTLRSSGLRKGVAKTLADLEGGGKSARTRAEKLAREAIKDLRQAADAIEKKLNVGGAGTRSSAAKKGAATRKRAAKKRSTVAKKAATTRARTARKTTTRKAGTARKTTARKAGTARKTVARTATSARKTVRRAVKRAS